MCLLGISKTSLDGLLSPLVYFLSFRTDIAIFFNGFIQFIQIWFGVYRNIFFIELIPVCVGF